MSVLTERRPRARKPHICSLCRREIAAGTTYRYYTYAYDGTVSTHREHPDCADVFYNEMWGGDPEDAPDPDELLEAVALRRREVVKS